MKRRSHAWMSHACILGVAALLPLSPCGPDGGWAGATAIAQEASIAAPGVPPGDTAAAFPATGSIGGFRGARFGMSEQPLRRGIQQDFPVAARRLSRTMHPREKTTVLTIVVEELLPDAGPARISYILGYASRRLIQVNITWTGDGRTALRDQMLVEAANSLRDHFLAQYHAPPDGVVANHPLGEHAMLVVRVRQPGGRMLLLVLSGVGAAGRTGGAADPHPLTLQLSYIADHRNPDVFRIEEGRF